MTEENKRTKEDLMKPKFWKISNEPTETRRVDTKILQELEHQKVQNIKLEESEMSLS